MRSVKPRLLCASLFLAAILLSSQVLAVEDATSTGQLRNDLKEIKARLATLEERQNEIIAKEDKILEEVDRVRIWVHRK